MHPSPTSMRPTCSIPTPKGPTRHSPTKKSLSEEVVEVMEIMEAIHDAGSTCDEMDTFSSRKSVEEEDSPMRTKRACHAHIEADCPR